MHVSQVAALLGLPKPDTTINAQVAWDIVAVLASWLEHFDRTTWEILNRPTPSRERTLRHLTVNMFHPIELLPGAWTDGKFMWDARQDPEREAAMPSMEQLRSWAQSVHDTWLGFVMDNEAAFEAEDREVDTLRGTVDYSVVLTAQRWHCAFHHRQLVDFLGKQGFDMSNALNVELLGDIKLAPNIY
jgi:hypothetical protein